MIETLYFLRHGLADWPDWRKPDDQRPLTEEGVKKMKASARTIAKLDLGLTLILSSPLVRARQTAEIVADRLGLKVTVHPALGVGFSTARLAGLLGECGDHKALLAVGHEPDLSEVIAGVVDGGKIVMKKGSLARIDMHSVEPLNGSLVWLLAPKVLTLEA
jgi:phosphohistidine phosphatase